MKGIARFLLVLFSLVLVVPAVQTVLQEGKTVLFIVGEERNTSLDEKKLKKELYEIIADHSGQKLSKVEKDSDRDYWMTAQEAKEYGLIDEVLVKKPR